MSSYWSNPENGECSSCYVIMREYTHFLFLKTQSGSDSQIGQERTIEFKDDSTHIFVGK